MTQYHLSTFSEAIKKFLEQLDSILNSNTYLLVFPALNSASPEKYFSELLKSGEFEKEFFRQDQCLQIPNYCMDSEADLKLIKCTDPSLTPFSLKDCREILKAMLTLQKLPDRQFFSPYRQGIPAEEAEPLVQDFLESLGMSGSDSTVYEIEPSFLYSEDLEAELESKTGREYFRSIGLDCALLFCTKSHSYILLVNGSD